MNSHINSFNLLKCLLISLIICSSIICEPVHHLIFENEWDILRDGWPIEDPEDDIAGKRSQFLYINDKDSALTWNMNTTFVEKLKNISSVFNIHFKTWLYYIPNQQIEPAIHFKNSLLRDVKDSYYDSNIIGQWSSTEFAVSFNELQQFYMRLNYAPKNIIALKNFTIEYETKDELRNDFVITNDESKSVFQMNHWYRFSNPVFNGTEEFMYFSNNCNEPHHCQLNTNEFVIQDNATVELSFWYYNSDAANNITVTQLSHSFATDINTWHLVKTPPINSPKSITLSITTKGSNGLDENAFFAIKDIKVREVGTTNTHSCTQFDCPFNASGFLWTRNNPTLSPGVFYYANSDVNSLAFIYNSANTSIFGAGVHLNEVCFLLEYYTAPEQHVKLNVEFSDIGDSYKDTILTIRPEVGEKDTKRLCMKDLIALNTNEFVISLHVIQNGIHDGVNGFALRPAVQLITLTQTFDNELLAFLSEWRDNNFLEWQSEWIFLANDPNKHFRKNPDSINFNANVNSKIPASAHLLSHWIKYDEGLHKIDSVYTVHTQPASHFNAFVVKPKVCDWLMHCNDVVITNETKSSDNTLRTYSFNFAHMKHSMYVKLMFYIEYYKPSDTVDRISFNLSLIHFGDQCYSSKCGDGCHSNKKNTTATPNVPVCECDSKYIQDGVCNIPNICNQKQIYKVDNVTMGLICYESDPELECANIFNQSTPIKARCVCNIGSKISWHEQNTTCIEPEVRVHTNWTEDVTSGYYYPSGDNNELVIDFAKIINTKHDVCLEVNYTSTEAVHLIVEYLGVNNTSKDMFALLVGSKPAGDQLNFCVRDFIYDYEEDFAIAFKARNMISWTESAFKLRYTQTVKLQTAPLKYLRNWHHELDSNYLKWIDWVTILPNGNAHVSNESTYQLNFTGNIEQTTLLVSEWVEYSDGLTAGDNILSYVYPLSWKSSFTVTLRILHKNNIKSDITSVVTSAVDGTHERATKTAFPIIKDSGFFKIIIEISYANKSSDSQPLLIEFETFSIGDPCFTQTNHNYICKSDQICVGLGTKNHTCVCKPNVHCDLECSTENKTHCEKFPSNPILTAQKCLKTNNTLGFQCNCAQDYVWNESHMRCVRKRYTKNVVKCEGPILADRISNCEFMDANARGVLQWSNGNLPPVRQLPDIGLPFYYPKNMNSTFKINVENLNKTTDACFKFRYYITEGAKLLLKFNDKPIIDITPTKVYNQTRHQDITEWLPENSNEEEICVRRFFFNNDETITALNITLVANIANISSDMIALKINNESYIRFPQDLLPAKELPYLIHWSRKSLNESFYNETEYKDDHYSHTNQWPLTFPSRKWNFSSDLTDAINFSDYPSGVHRKAYLMSNWLRKNIDGYRLRFNIKSASFVNFAINTSIYDSDMNIVQTFDDHIIGDSQILTTNLPTIRNTTMLYRISKRQTSFKVGFTVHYQLPLSSSRHSPIVFRIESIDVGDPCVNDDTTRNNCSDHGYCIRHGPVDDYDCKCLPTWTAAKNCAKRNYCEVAHPINGVLRTGSDYCSVNHTQCIPNQYDSFECNCTEKSEFLVWNATSKTCHTDKCKTFRDNCDAHTQKCDEPDREDLEAKCICRDGYNTTALVFNYTIPCELNDPCKHKENRCGTEGIALCFHDSGDNEYECRCPIGYETIGQKTETKCKPKVCDIHGENNCQQKCSPIDSGFVCNCTNTELYDWRDNACHLIDGKVCNCGDGQFCTVNGGPCTCATGYTLNSTTNKCDINQNSVDPEFCGNMKPPKVDSGGQLVCECDGSIFNNTDRRCPLKPLCGANSAGRESCSAKMAKCVTHKDTLTVWCVCPFGKIFEDAINTEMVMNDTRNFTCVDVCEVDNRIERCELRNAQCVASKLLNDLTPKSVTEAGDWSKFCACKPGYVLNTNADRCVIAVNAYSLSLAIKNNYQYNNISIKSEKLVHFYRENARRKRQAVTVFDSLNSENKYRYFHDVNSSYHFNTEIDSYSRENVDKNVFADTLSKDISGILSSKGLTTRDVSVESCELNTENYYVCVFSVLFADSALVTHPENITDKLSPLCNNPNGECNATGNPLIFRNIQANLYDHCDDSRKDVSCPQYTTCKRVVNDVTHSDYTCVCNRDYFERTSNRTIANSKGSTHTVIETCRPKDLCVNHCKGGDCYQMQPIYANGEWRIERHCVCKTEQQILSTTGDECLEPCVNAQPCSNHGSCHVSTVNRQFVCNCEKGYYGDHCENSRSITGWVVGVCVLAVLLLLAVCLALWFAYKNKQSSKRTTMSGGYPNQGLSLEDLQTTHRGAHHQQSSMFNK